MAVNFTATLRLGKNKDDVIFANGGTASSHAVVVIDTVKVKTASDAARLLETIAAKIRERNYPPK